ncbi:MAG: prepilin-type N-terminal cleavage/methylation domain-containing protein [Patescibacteria group bacterium]|nr:prepilin-type N-terminal cleavage/methylation domain-containing protein [Patescibacteria group bacterium]
MFKVSQFIFQRRKGFTLIEMLIVIAIIAILASVFLVGLRGFRGSAYDSRRIADLQKVQSYLETIYTQTRAYPAATSWSDLQTQIVNANLGISNVPNDPLSESSGQNYIYCYETAGKQGYILGAVLSTSGHSALKESYHGSITGYNCTQSLDCSVGSQNLCVNF